jgi:hypothetical protein
VAKDENPFGQRNDAAKRACRLPASRLDIAENRVSLDR